uniref:Cathepsin propeptide inhibitor domain-containing protein n=1 Tax=Oncorhynchus tshawytscha TaxID=74940 RepID=A0AAZ3RZS3_ONCTS
MKSLVLLLLVAVTVSSVLSTPLPEDSEAEVHKEFETWKVKYGKSYPSTEEEAKRKEMWLATRKRVMEHNVRAGNGLESFTMAVNHFADLVRFNIYWSIINFQLS